MVQIVVGCIEQQQKDPKPMELNLAELDRLLEQADRETAAIASANDAEAGAPRGRAQNSDRESELPGRSVVQPLGVASAAGPPRVPPLVGRLQGRTQAGPLSPGLIASAVAVRG